MNFKTSSVSICNSSTEKFWWQIYCKNWFSDRAFYFIITVADIKNLNSLHTLFDKYLVKLEQNLTVGNIHDFEFFGKKLLTIFEKVLTPFWKTFLQQKQLFDVKVLKDYHLSLLQKLQLSVTCNQVKTCIKHGISNQS